MIKSAISIVLLTTSLACSSNGSDKTVVPATLPQANEVFTIAVEPQNPQHPAYFTPETLKLALSKLKPGTPEIADGAKHFWQSGVIVLKNKEVLFWTTCRNDFLLLRTSTASSSYIIGGRQR